MLMVVEPEFFVEPWVLVAVAESVQVPVTAIVVLT